MRNLIFGLARPMLRLLGHDERGGVAVLVAILLGGGVLFGMAAMTIDVGRLYQNRAELQNGASAAALAVAGSCANGNCTQAAALPLAQSAADANASKLTGHTAAVDLICGSDGLGACPPSTGTMTDCPPPPDNYSYVDVHTSTLNPNNSPLLPPIFAQTLLGQKNYKGSTVYACAQAEWGNGSTSDSLALTVSLCAWNSLINDTDFTASPTSAYNTDDVGLDGDSDDNSVFNTLIPLWIKGTAAPCKPSPSGTTLPSGFGWLMPNCQSTGTQSCSNPCTTTIDINYSTNPPTGTGYTDPGSNVTNDCKTALQNDIGTTVFIPVFDAYTAQGSSGTYHVIGLAAFFLTGFANMTGIANAGVPSPAGVSPSDSTGYSLCLSNPDPSVDNQECIEGYFTQALTNLPGQPSQGPPFGAGVIRLSG